MNSKIFRLAVGGQNLINIESILFLHCKTGQNDVLSKRSND